MGREVFVCKAKDLYRERVAVRMRGSLVLLVVLLLFSATNSVATDFDTIRLRPRLGSPYEHLLSYRSFRWPSQVVAALVANAASQTYPADRFANYGPVSIHVDGEQKPIAEADVVIVDKEADKQVVFAGEVNLRGDAEEARRRLTNLRAALLVHRREKLIFRSPADKMKVIGNITPQAPLPKLVTVGPWDMGGSFHLTVPIANGEQDVLFRALLHRKHPEDIKRITEYPKLQAQFDLLLAQSEPIKVVGQVLEVLVRHHMSQTSHQEPEFWSTGGLEYRYEGSDFVVGELDILAVRRSDHKVVLIGECKLSSGNTFKKALAKAQKQMKRIKEALEGPDSDKLRFHYVPNPEEQFNIEDFRGVDTEYRIYGSSGAVAYGFHEEIELARSDGDVLFREIQFRQRDEKPVSEILSKSSCRKLLEMRKSLISERIAHDESFSIQYGERTAALEKYYPEYTMLVKREKTLLSALTSLANVRAPWHEVAEIFRGHKYALNLLRTMEAPRCNAVLFSLDCPEAAASAILAAHGGPLK